MTTAINTLKAKEIMRTSVVTVRQEDTIPELMETLKRHNISGAPVVDGNGQVTGVVSVTDLIRYNVSSTPDKVFLKDAEEPCNYYTYGEALETDYMDGYYSESIRDVRVKEIMTDCVFSVTMESDIPAIASLMVEKQIHRVVVLDKEKLAGIISTLDVMKLLTRK